MEVTNPQFRLDGKRAVITGASSGIGLAAAKALAEAGAHVTMIARGIEATEKAAAEFRRQGLVATALSLDVTDEASVRNVLPRSGPFDILLNNAGTHSPQPFLEIDTKTFDRLFQLNVRGAFFVAQVVAQQMAAEKIAGVIIHTSSQLGHVGAAGRTTYTATKHALEGMSKCMALDLAPYGIRVVTVSPTFTETEMTKKVLTSAEARQNLLSRLPIGRFALPEDIAGIVVFLASPAAGMITGSSVMADGGWTAL